MALGADIGGVAGAIAGSVIPGIGTAAGAGAGAAIGGGVDAIIGAGKRKAALNQLPPEVDPLEMQNLNQIALQRKQFMTGTAFSNATGDINKQLGATDAGAIQAAGGNSGAAIAAMLRASATAGNNYAKVAGEGLNQQDILDQSYTNILQRVAARKLAIQKQRYQQNLLDSTQEEQTGSQNLMAGLSRLGNISINGGKSGVDRNPGAVIDNTAGGFDSATSAPGFYNDVPDNAVETAGTYA